MHFDVLCPLTFSFFTNSVKENSGHVEAVDSPSERVNLGTRGCFLAFLSSFGADMVWKSTRRGSAIVSVPLLLQILKTSLISGLDPCLAA